MATIKDGKEILSSAPMQMPIGFEHPEPLHEKIRRLVRSEKLRLEVEALGKETPEEADDFDVGDEYDPRSPYELNFDQEQIALRSGVNVQNPEFIEETPGDPRDIPDPKANAAGLSGEEESKEKPKGQDQ